MGWYVHLSVVFSCDENEPVAEVAKRHIGKMGDCREAEWFLADLANRTGHNPGPKGGLSLWGITGNYTKGGEFCEALMPFWRELFESGAGPLDFEHIIVFEEQEQSEAANAHEISYDEQSKQVRIKHHERLPFAWMQM